jgi:hypothetical protein
MPRKRPHYNTPQSNSGPNPSLTERRTGGFYGSIQIRGVDRSAVKVAVEKLTRNTNLGFLLGPKLGDWVGVYPEGGGQDSQIGRKLSRKLRAEQFQLVVHDDDVYTYEYYRDGKLLDQFNSRPYY